MKKGVKLGLDLQVGSASSDTGVNSWTPWKKIYILGKHPISTEKRPTTCRKEIIKIYFNEKNYNFINFTKYCF